MVGLDRVPLALTAGRPRDSKMRLSPQRQPPQTAEKRCSPAAGAWYAPPMQRLVDALQDCAGWDRELKALETSGYTRLGVFAKPLAMQSMRQSAGNSKSKSIRKAKRAPPSQSPAEEEADGTELNDEQNCTDPFFLGFYDEQGRSLAERLLRGRMRVLALEKLEHGKHSLGAARASLELGEVYARLNLWKQAQFHGSIAADLLQDLEFAAQRARKSEQEVGGVQACGDHDEGRDKPLRLALEFFYDTQCDEDARGCVDVDALCSYLEDERAFDGPKSSLVAVFEPDALRGIMEEAQILHWQHFLLKLEGHSAALQRHLAQIAERLPVGVEHMLRALFTSLDVARDGVVPFHAFLERLRSVARPNNGSQVSSVTATELRELVDTLQRVLDRVGYHSLAWTELLTLSVDGASVRLPEVDEQLEDGQTDQDNPAALLPRAKLLLARVLLRRGQLEEAARVAQVAVATQERLEPDSANLVPFYLVAAEGLARRGRQLRVLARQSRRERAERWFQSPEGTRRVRNRALELLELASDRGNPLPSKKDAEIQARVVLLQEIVVSPCPPSWARGTALDDSEAIPMQATSSALLEEALECCAKAWALQECHFGRDHVTTAAVHVCLAQVHLLRGDDSDRERDTSEAEAARCFLAAIAVLERACQGPVPASAFLQLELAKLYSQDSQSQRRSEARAAYETAGRFFLSFAGEFAGSETTRRECCALSLDALRQWMVLARAEPGNHSDTSLDAQREVLAEVHAACVTGYGEFSVEACESAADLARVLRQLAAAECHAQSEARLSHLRAASRLLRDASYVAENVLGAGDRRSRKLRKSALEVAAQLRSARGSEDDGGGDGDDWLVL